jgi:hypothetical protein
MRNKTIQLVAIMTVAFAPLAVCGPVFAQEKAMTNKDCQRR